MKTMFSPLFRPFAIVDFPIRYFILLFLAAIGLVQLVNTISKGISGGIIIDESRMLAIVFLVSLLISIANYFQEKKMRSESTQ